MIFSRNITKKCVQPSLEVTLMLYMSTPSSCISMLRILFSFVCF